MMHSVLWMAHSIATGKYTKIKRTNAPFQMVSQTTNKLCMSILRNRCFTYDFIGTLKHLCSFLKSFPLFCILCFAKYT